MKTIEEIANNNIDNSINEDLSYDKIINLLKEAQEQDIPIEEGIIGAIAGAITGATFGPKIGNAICSALGIDPRGSLGSLITSRLITTAIGTKIGLKM